MISIGFTGTQIGMTDAQKASFTSIISRILVLGKITLHHGDCVGADADAHDIASGLGCEIVIHPPTIPTKRAFKQGKCLEPKQYLVRNHDIVDATRILIATPKERNEELRSGTWATIRYAKKTNKNIYVIYPDGTHEITGVA